MEKYPEERQILIHPLPLVPVSKCMEGSSVLTDIIIGKFMYHLPFYRLTQQYRESGIGISESTMCGWYEMAVEKRKLLYNLLKQKILSSDYMQVDESVIPVMDNEKHKAKKGDEWCVRDGVTGDVMFHYDRGSRSGMVARELLECYRSIVQCDGYAAYVMITCLMFVSHRQVHASLIQESGANLQPPPMVVRKSRNTSGKQDYRQYKHLVQIKILHA